MNFSPHTDLIENVTFDNQTRGQSARRLRNRTLAASQAMAIVSGNSHQAPLTIVFTVGGQTDIVAVPAPAGAWGSGPVPGARADGAMDRIASTWLAPLAANNAGRDLSRQIW